MSYTEIAKHVYILIYVCKYILLARTVAKTAPRPLSSQSRSRSTALHGLARPPVHEAVFPT